MLPQKTPSLLREMRLLTALALPVVISQIGQVSMGFVDTVMVGHVGEEALAAVALGNTFSMALLLLGMGILMGLDPLISQAYGAGDRKKCGSFVQAGLVVSAGISLPVTLLFIWSAPILRLLGQKEELVILASKYLWAVAPGVFPFFLFIALRQFVQALGLMKPVMVVVLVANGFNVLANWVLVFGKWGFPTLGSTGTGYATMLSDVFMALSLLGYVYFSPGLKEYPWIPRWKSLDFPSIRKLLSLGTPIGIQLGLEVWSFCSVTLLMGWLGTVELGGHQITMNLAALVFMVPVGIGAAACVRVGHSWGRSDPEGASRTSQAALLMVLCTATFSATLFAVFPQQVASLYTHKENLILMAVTLLPLAALFQFSDGLQAVGFGLLRGVGDTRVPLIFLLFGYWTAGIPLGYYWTFHRGFGPRGLWWGLVIGLTTVASLLLLRIYFIFKKREVKTVF